MINVAELEGGQINRHSPLLSIVTICYNNANGLRETLNSVWNLQRGFRDFEQVVVDGGSTDLTGDVIREYQDRLSWWCSEPDKGIYNAMNKGAEHATGEYLLFLNSGDVLLDDSLKDVFASEFSEDLVYGDIYTSDGANKHLIKSPSQAELTPAYLTINTLPHQATLIRRELHIALGGYDETMKISAAPKFIIDALLGRKCTHRYLEFGFSVFDRSGISSDVRKMPEKLREWQYFIRPHFGERVANAFYRSKISEKVVSMDVVRYVSDHPEKMSQVWSAVNDIVALIKHGQYKSLKEISLKTGQLEKTNAELVRRVHSLDKKVKDFGFEVKSLKESFAYRVGMIVTWPLRLLYRRIGGK